jgi:hypothetical protein
LGGSAFLTPTPQTPRYGLFIIKDYRHFSIRVPVPSVVQAETGTATSPQFQAAVRELSNYDYHRLLIAEGVTLSDIETLPADDDLLDGLVSQLSVAPKDIFRMAPVIPDGTGYVWQGGAMPNLAESAALQERARTDHHNVLRHISRLVEARGGNWFYNNNIDLYAKIGEQRLLVEAKSLANPDRAVDRMRYGMGQLFDYRVRYEAEVAGADPLLAFRTPPERRDAWIANILEGNSVALVGLINGSLRALNPRAERLAIVP